MFFLSFLSKSKCGSPIVLSPSVLESFFLEMPFVETGYSFPRGAQKPARCIVLKQTIIFSLFNCSFDFNAQANYCTTLEISLGVLLTIFCFAHAGFKVSKKQYKDQYYHATKFVPCVCCKTTGDFEGFSVENPPQNSPKASRSHWR